MNELLLVSTIIRESKIGEPHGAIFIVNTFNNSCIKVFDWSVKNINWQGGGGDRGLRGISFYNDNIFVAANNSILVLDKKFNVIEILKNNCLNLCHEICIYDNKLYISSTGFDMIVIYDLISKKFIKYVEFSGNPIEFNVENNFCERRNKNEWHINSVFHDGKFLYVSTGLTGDVFILNKDLELVGSPRCQFDNNSVKPKIFIKEHELNKTVKVHNSYPFRGGYIFNCTESSSVIFWKDNKIEWITKHPPYVMDENIKNSLKYMKKITDKYLKKAEDKWILTGGWARGLCFNDEFIFSGTSPASIIVLNSKNGEFIKNINLIDNLRHSVHGLEIIPENFL